MRAKINLCMVMFFLAAVSPLHAEESVSWEQCASEAKRAHPDFYTALALLQQAEADKQVTGGSRLPQLSLSVSSLKNGTSGFGSSSLSSYALSAQQLIYDGGKTSNQIASNTEAIKAAQYNYDAVSANVRFALRSAFTQLLKAQELVGLAGEIATRRQNNVRLISLRYQGGREHIGSLRQAEADLAQSQFEVSQAKRGLVLAETTLASALGRDTHQPLRVQGAFKVSDLTERKPDLAWLAKNHPLFQQLDTKSKAARFDLDASRSAFSPEAVIFYDKDRRNYKEGGGGQADQRDDEAGHEQKCFWHKRSLQEHSLEYNTCRVMGQEYTSVEAKHLTRHPE